MKAIYVLLVMLLMVNFQGFCQTVEATSEYSYVSIGKWKNANADVDKKIPETNTKNKNLVALIIGNEDYHSYQRGLNSENDIDFAENDARVFKDYVVKTLGAEEKNVLLLINGNSVMMQRNLKRLLQLADFAGDEAEIIFYYSGHGLPDEKTKEGYLIPVDIGGADLQLGMKIDDVYQQLSQQPCKKATVFLDACFSGGARNKALLSLKGVKINPKQGAILGNLVVFSSSSGDESSAVYNEMGHGFFTYFLLKKIQSTGGNVTYDDLYNYIKENVRETAFRTSDKVQTPNLIYSKDIENKLAEWKLK